MDFKPQAGAVEEPTNGGPHNGNVGALIIGHDRVLGLLYSIKHGILRNSLGNYLGFYIE